jgi:hypothetical protein
MGRKKNETTLAPAAPGLNGDIIDGGDFAGLRASDVLRALADGIHELLGQASIEAAGASLDLALGEYLSVVEGTTGAANAKAAALAFCETVMPYAALPVKVASSYGEARKIKGGRKDV